MKPHDIFSLLGSIVLVTLVTTVLIHPTGTVGFLKAFTGGFGYDLKVAQGRG